MENLQGPETANRRPRRFNAKGRRNELEVGVGDAAVSGADSFSTRKAPGGLRPRRSVVVGSLTLLVSGLVITATAIPVSANGGTTRFASPATSISTARTSTAAPRVAPSGALVSYSPTSTKSGVQRASRSTSRHRRNQQNVAPTTTTTAVTSFSPIPTTTLAPTTKTTLAPTTKTAIAPTTKTAIAPTTTTTAAPTTTTTAAPTTTPSPPAVVASAFPTGVANNSEPSGYAPPGSNALAGYTQIYTSDFSGSSLPAGWEAYSGTPGGDPGGQFGGNAHIAVGGGLLQLNTFLDPAYNNEWVTGGLCQCGLSQTYGAYFVRSRVTGAGPTGVELLWPVANVWPPEIDFNETGGQIGSTTATNIWALSGGSKQQSQVSLSID